MGLIRRLNLNERVASQSFRLDIARAEAYPLHMELYSESYRITSYLVNLRHRAGLYAILNLIQDVGWQHAVALGFKLDEQGLAWVFTRQKLVMSRWPEWNEIVTLRTWLRPPENTAFVFREYELLVGKEKVGECTSSFTLIDMESRKVARPDWSALGPVFRHEGSLSLRPEKVPPLAAVEDRAEFQVRNSDLDLNNHVNNTKYAQWVLDAIPTNKLKSVELEEYEINFLAETKMGDVVTLQQGREELTQFQGLRKSDEKIVFTARMRIR